MLSTRTSIYIRKLTYKVSYDINDDDLLLSPILSNFLPTTSRLNFLVIDASSGDWNTLPSSLTSGFLHLIHWHLPTINHVRLSNIVDFPLSSLTSCVNLHRLDIHSLECSDNSSLKTVESEMVPKIRKLHTSNSSLVTKKLLLAKMQNGGPAFNPMDLRRLWMQLKLESDSDDIYCGMSSYLKNSISQLILDGF